MKIKLLLADDHKLVRGGLRNFIDSHSDMEVVGEAENGRHAVQLALELAPDVVLMDVAMPEMNGIDAPRQIVARAPHVRVLGLSLHESRGYVDGMLEAGASGYLLKDHAFEELADAVRAVAAGQICICPSLADRAWATPVSQPNLAHN